MSVTATQLIYGALRLLGVLRAGMTANSDHLADGLVGLNDVLETWSIEPLTVFETRVDPYALTPGVQFYTYGAGGTLNGPRPNRIVGVNLLYTNGSTLHLPVNMLSLDQWRAVRLQSISSTIPTQVYIDGAFPLRNVAFLPFPSGAASVEFYTWQAFTAFADLTTPTTFPTGYARALRYALALEMAPSFAIAAKSPAMYEAIAATAAQTKATIQNLNLPAPVMTCDPAMLSRREGQGLPNILTGWY